MKIAFVDTYYPPVLDFPLQPIHGYQDRLKEILELRFGTSSFYSDAFKQMGWDAIDIIANDTVGRQRWCEEMGIPYGTNAISVLDQLAIFEPDVVYCQDLSFFRAPLIQDTKRKYGWKWAAQHSCPWAGDEQVGAFDLVFTSFPHYLPRISKLGVQTGFLPIAFGHRVLDEIEPTHRDLPVSFVGGVNGTSGHWSRGTEFLNEIAEAIPRFKWWGYWIGDGSQCPALQRSFQGPAWGLNMYSIYARSQIVVNRHGEVAEGFANNMRMFEATGMGALLLTERATNLRDYFEPNRDCIAYDGAGHAVSIIKQLLWQPEIIENIAQAGQARTLEQHTYERRLMFIDQPLRGLCT